MSVSSVFPKHLFASVSLVSLTLLTASPTLAAQINLSTVDPTAANTNNDGYLLNNATAYTQ